MAETTTKLLQHPRPSEALYWSAPFVADGDFAPEDPLALDYIGQQVGNLILPTLTTRTSRAQNYAVVLFGLDLAERARLAYGLPSDDSTRVALFERWERFWCLSVLEYHDGPLARGDDDAMRGIRGASRAWFRGEARLPLDFALISRQSELGSLGAYLSSLRALSLVTQGTLRPTMLATDILSAFWDERENANVNAFDEYALAALQPDLKTIARRDAKVTLRGVGERTRLGCLTARARTAQQRRLDEALFPTRDEYTFTVANLVKNAVSSGVAEPRTFFSGASAGKYGKVGDELAERLHLAWAFSAAAKHWLDAFNAVYHEAWKADGFIARDRAEKCLAEHLSNLATVSKQLLSEPAVLQIRQLPVHGRGFLQLVECGASESAAAVLDQLLAFHARVQHDRRGARGWLGLEAARIVVELSSYTGHQSKAAYPSLKFDVVRSLLRDLGRVK